MNESVRKIIEYQLKCVKETEEFLINDREHLDANLKETKIKLDSIVKEKKELELFLSEHPH